MKITFFEIEGWEIEFLKKNLPKHKLNFIKDELTPKNAQKAKDTDVISIFAHSEVDEKTISKLPKLKSIVTRTTGFDHIDLNLCKKRKIKIQNVPFYGENTVAEHTFALILSLSRKIFLSCEKTKKRDFSLTGIRGFDLKGKTLGIIGTGNIGSHVAQIANGFEMKILAFSKTKSKKLIKNFGAKYTSLNNLLKNSDIITLHLPLNDETRHILNKKNFPLIKKGAYIINTARGGLIDTTELIKGLNKKQIAGAGLDVLEEEETIMEEKPLVTKYLKSGEVQCLVENHALLNYDNVIITPHNAFNSQEALQRILDTTVKNIKSVTKSKPINLVR